MAMKRYAVVLAACARVALCVSIGATVASAAGGTVSGTVKYDGTAPTPRKVEVTKDKEVCGLHPHFEEELIRGRVGGRAKRGEIMKGAKGGASPEGWQVAQQG